MKIPTSHGQLTIKQFIELCEIMEQPMELFDKKLKLITMLTGRDAELIPFKYTSLWDRLTKRNLTWYIKQIEKLLASPKPETIKNHLWVGKKRFFTSLDATTLNANQYTALSTYTANGNADKNIVKCLALLYTRHKLFGSPESFNTNKLNEIESELMNARLSEVYGTLVFFCAVVEQLNAISQYYLVMTEIMVNETIRDLTRTDNSNTNMDGIT